MQAAVVDEWLSGDLKLPYADEARGAIGAFTTMSGLLGPDHRDGTPAFEQIRAFYGQLEAHQRKEADAAQADQAHTENQD